MFVRIPAFFLRCTVAQIHLFSRSFSKYRHLASLPESTQVVSDVNDELELFSSFARMQQRDASVPINPYFLNKFISVCAKLSSLSLGEQAHSATIKLGYDSNVFIGTALIDIYCKCGKISRAHQLFDEMPERNVVTWNSLISGYSQAQFSTLAIGLFFEMLKVDIIPTSFTLSAVLVSCSELEATELGIQVHGLGLKYGFCSNIVLGTALVDMYSKCSNSDDSRKCFNEMPERNVVTWTSMVSSYSHNGQPDEAMVLVKDMRRVGVRLNKVTYNSLLSSFSSPNDLYHGRQVHCQVIQEGLDSDKYLIATLLTMYSECGCLEDFCKISQQIVSTTDQISWNSVISGFSSLGIGEEAFKCFTRMRKASIRIDFITFTNVLKAISILSALEEGKQTHALVLKTGFASNLHVQNGLVSMYARCGAIEDSKKVFLSIEQPDFVSWNSLLSGCAQHGYGIEAVELFEKMRRMGIRPNHATFLSVLSACSHVGLLERGLEYFGLMKEDDLVGPPRLEHYACVVDLLSRAGYLNEAESFVKSMPIMPGPSVYKALLSACRVHGHVGIAIRSAKRLFELCPNDPSAYLLLSSVLAEGGCWDEAAAVRKLMCERGVKKKKPGYSWIEVNDNNISQGMVGLRLTTTTS